MRTRASQAAAELAVHGLASLVLLHSPMCTVGEIMTRKVLWVAAEAAPDDAAWGFSLKGFSGAPVKDVEGTLIGVLSKSDLVDPDKRDEPASRRATVRDVMTPVLLTARSTDPVRFAVRRMLESGTHRLVVVDEGGALVGIVTPMDVLRGLLDGKFDAREFEGA